MRALFGVTIAVAASIGTPSAGALVDGPLVSGATVTQPAVRLSASSPAGRRALDVLATIPVGNEQRAGYDRSLFGYPSAQGNGCDTRDRVLIRDSLTPAQVDPVGCAVIAGDWYSTYDNITTSDLTDTTIDHVVALAEAWDSGAHSWTNGRRVDFANDLADTRSLRVVTAGVNSSKGAADPSNWIPSHPPAVCGYLADWVSIKARWSLTMDQSEHGRIRNLGVPVVNGRCSQPVNATPSDSR